MFWLWLIVAIVLFGVGTYSIGRFDNSDPVGLFWLCFFVAGSWPAVLIATVSVGPFFGLFWLGDRKREKLKKEKSTDNK